jgi:hypothetical protein
VGGSTWVQDATWLVWNGQDMDRKALDMGKQRSEKLLQNAAELKLSFDKPGFVSLRITNLSGHKLPSGYPEGRRMWINVKFFNSSGEVLGEIGKYGPKESVIFGEPVNAPTLLDAVATRVYECVPAMSEKQAKKYGKKPGKSFHFVLNDIIIKDNRIPPEGFKNSSFKEHLCEPIEATYEDGQYWDDIDFKLPSECSRVVVKLMYQSVSWEYIKFLAEENRTDDWGRRLYDAWNQTGKCSPTVMAEISSEIKD